MKYKAYIVCSLIAALLCVLSIVFLSKEISSVSQKSQTISSIRLEYFAFQIGRNYDELARSLVFHRDCRIPVGVQALGEGASKEYVEKFDIVWSGFKSAYTDISKYWSSTGYWLDEGRAANATGMSTGGLEFLAKYQADISLDKELSCSKISEILSDIFLQKEAISEFSQGHFELDQKVAWEEQAGKESQYRSMLFLTVSFLAACILAAILLVKALREARVSNQTSREADYQAMLASNELRESVSTNVAQNKFFAAASHDLRQPLHALGLYIGSLSKHVDSADARHILHCASLSTDSLSGLLDSLLDISRLDAGEITSNKSQFDVSTVLANVYRRFLPEANEKGLELHFLSDESWVYSDAQLLDRIIQNLLSNALNYTPEGRIEISSTTENGEVVISITDTGCGIPESEQGAVFTEFYQLHDKERDRGNGIGLGLSIVSRLTSLLDIDLQMNSKLGLGTQFTLKLPVSKGQISSRRAGMPVEVRAALNVDLAGIKILLVDDDKSVRDATKVLLQAENCIVRVTEDIETAVQLCSNGGYHPDVILADYRLIGQKTGFDAIVILRQVLKRTVPAILITGDTTVDFRTEIEETNLDVLYKPVDTAALIVLIAQLVSLPNQS